MKTFLHRLLKNTRGAVAIEFILVAPIIIILILGTIEIGRFIIISQKVSKTAYALGDLVSQIDPMTECAVQDAFTLANFTLAPFDITADQLTNNATFNIIAINRVGGTNAETWRCFAGTPSATTPGQGLTLQNGEGTYMIEVSYNYAPIFVPAGYNDFFMPGDQRIFQRSYVRPRRSNLAPTGTEFGNASVGCAIAPNVVPQSTCQLAFP